MFGSVFIFISVIISLFFSIQAGQYTEAYSILEERVEYEEEQLGQRSDELADVYQAMAKCKSEVRKSWHFV